jgi:hypothetical protein
MSGYDRKSWLPAVTFDDLVRYLGEDGVQLELRAHDPKWWQFFAVPPPPGMTKSRHHFLVNVGCCPNKGSSQVDAARWRG